MRAQDMRNLKEGGDSKGLYSKLALADSGSDTEPFTVLICPFNATAQIAIPWDDDVQEIRGDFSVHQFDKKTQMDQSVKSFWRIQKGAKYSAAIIYVVRDCFF